MKVFSEVVTQPATSAPDLTVHIGELTLANPIMPASGCFGPELAPMLDFGVLGALVTKTVFAVQRAGNPAHRLTETSYGMSRCTWPAASDTATAAPPAPAAKARKAR